MEMQRLCCHNANVAKEAEWHLNSQEHSAQLYQRRVIHMRSRHESHDTS